VEEPKPEGSETNPGATLDVEIKEEESQLEAV
jgi:hypothetical protein